MLVLLLAVTPARSNLMFTYDPALGTLPDTQGFTFVNGDPTAPAPQVVQGILQQGPTTTVGTQYWIRTNTPFAFDQNFSVEADIKVVSSTYSANVGDGTQRSGFYLEAIDTLGHRMTLGISNSGVTINTDRGLFPANGLPLVPFGTQGAFHHYAVSVQGNKFALTIDGVPSGSANMGAALFLRSDNCVYFGDGTNAGSSQVEIGQVRYAFQPTPPAGVDDSPRANAGGLKLATNGGFAAGTVDLVVSAGTSEPVRVRVLDLGGRVVRDLGEIVAGPQPTTLRWDREDISGHTVPAGVYFAIASGAHERSGCRLVVLR